ncbi:MAG TPA: helix-turn-helix transcriptional regulator [Chthoniobacter sp.]|nr:helix-turn-helix transcriptional regulator [Chthoniobacter sp.]
MADSIHLQIKKARLERKMGQEDLAKMFGKSQSSISQYEKGKTTKLSAEVVQGMCEFFGIDPSGAPTAEIDLQQGEEDVAAFCGNHECPAALRVIIRGKLHVQPVMYRVWRGPDANHCPACQEVLSFGCSKCLTPVVNGAVFCLCGKPLVKTPPEWAKAEGLEETAKKENLIRETFLAGQKIQSLPRLQLGNQRLGGRNV